MLRHIWTPSSRRGFLPICNPSYEYEHYKLQPLSALLDEMPVHLPQGRNGILSVPGDIVDITKKELSGSNEITKSDICGLLPHETYGLFRDLTFLASGYLLEPTYHHYMKKGEYGPGRDVLPEYISRPLHIVSEKIGCRPFMEYNQSYALYNWKLRNTEKPPTYDNVKLIRRLEGGASEDGFIRVHIDMVAESYHLVSGVSEILYRRNMHGGLTEITTSMNTILDKFHKMWSRSRPRDYGAFRSFIFGTKNQDMIFPNGGIRYLGVGADDTYVPYRGESGANDSMIPLLDNLVQLSYPQNELTNALQDFRSYRPHEHITYLDDVAKKSKSMGLRHMMLSKEPKLYHTLLSQIASFRKLHWDLTRKYIIEEVEYPTATGGTPITRWLPNQLQTVYKQILEDFPNDSLTKELARRLDCEVYEVQHKMDSRVQDLFEW